MLDEGQPVRILLQQSLQHPLPVALWEGALRTGPHRLAVQVDEERAHVLRERCSAPPLPFRPRGGGHEEVRLPLLRCGQQGEEIGGNIDDLRLRGLQVEAKGDEASIPEAIRSTHWLSPGLLPPQTTRADGPDGTVMASEALCWHPSPSGQQRIQSPPLLLREIGQCCRYCLRSQQLRFQLVYHISLPKPLQAEPPALGDHLQKSQVPVQEALAQVSHRNASQTLP